MANTGSTLSTLSSQRPLMVVVGLKSLVIYSLQISLDSLAVSFNWYQLRESEQTGDLVEGIIN